MKKKECAKNLTFDTPSSAFPEVHCVCLVGLFYAKPLKKLIHSKMRLKCPKGHTVGAKVRKKIDCLSFVSQKMMVI